MKVLVLGASGATGKLVVRQLVKRDIEARIVVREGLAPRDETRASDLVEVVTGNIVDFGAGMNALLIEGCDAVVCCLGHNMTLKGLFGQPRSLVYRAVKNLCDAIHASGDKKIKVVLMNTTGNINPEIQENRSMPERAILALLTLLLPPQRDNVEAARYLSAVIGRGDAAIEWVAVRPDSLIDADAETFYEVFEAPQRSPLFNAGKTSRINVSAFMAELLTNDDTWTMWKYRMPVIYDIARVSGDIGPRP
jgi:nucleoside-diphosphate-sugar epimerase